MLKVRTLLCCVACIILICPISHAYPYRAIFNILPHEIHTPGYDPGIGMRVWFGPILNTCDYHWWCQPPPPLFAVQVDWESPNQANCYEPVFLGFLSYEWYIMRTYLGRGTGGLIDYWPRDMCCYYPFHCGFNRFDIKIGPLVSGRYRVRLYSMNWSLWDPNGCNELKPNWMWDRFRWYQTAQYFVKIQSTLHNYSDFMRIFYVDEATKDTIYTDQILNVLSEYSLHCKIRSDRRSEDMPSEIWGEFQPQDVSIPTRVRLIRAPREDERQPCDSSYPLRVYGYRSVDQYRPLDFWDIDPGEWSHLSKVLTCVIEGAPIQISYDVTINELVLSDLALIAVNDSTFGFIPTRDEKAGFKFSYSTALGLNRSSRINFNILDKDNRLVYFVPVPIADPQREPDDLGLPDLPILKTIPLYWNGRINQSLPDLNHLADPDKGPYRAHVFVDEGDGLMTNVDTFSVIPMIDSILLTHSPSFPPPQRNDRDTVYCVIKAKIDDSDIFARNYRYYIPPAQQGLTNPPVLGFWVNARNAANYHFWDADDEQNKKYFYEYNQAQVLPINAWDIEQFGALDYIWKIIHDKRQGAGSCQVDYSEIIDTTQSWGNNWRAELIPPTNWSSPDRRPYMRILCYNEVTNSKNNYILQADTSSMGRDAHKIIFSYNTFVPNWDIVDWAFSYIGVPYGWCGPSGKLPYEKLDCASLVTATKVQELMTEFSPQPLKIGPMTSLDYYYGSYGIPPIRITTPEIIDTLNRDPDFQRMGGRGYLIFVRKKDDMSPSWINTRHIMIVYYMAIDPVTSKPLYCSVINERGGYSASGKMGRVRYDNAMAEWPPYHPDWFPNGEYIWTILKWEL